LAAPGGRERVDGARDVRVDDHQLVAVDPGTRA
jgi:hypothetical protein